MKKRVFIIHGCPSDKEKAMNPATRTYDKHWIPWIKKELNKFGAILLSPPIKNKVKKFHICGNCYKKIIKFLGIKK
jgi:hypothetical protein